MELGNQFLFSFLVEAGELRKIFLIRIGNTGQFSQHSKLVRSVPKKKLVYMNLL